LGTPNSAQARGGLILVADNRDAEPLGSRGYRTSLALLKEIGPEAFDRLLASPDWRFIVDQWEAQMWGKVLKRVQADDFVYFAPQLGPRDRALVPGVDGRSLLGKDRPREGCSAGAASAAEEVCEVISRAVARFLARRGFAESDVASGAVRLAWLADGPYGIPIPAGRP
jgi:hypothetical protein